MRNLTISRLSYISSICVIAIHSLWGYSGDEISLRFEFYMPLFLNIFYFLFFLRAGYFNSNSISYPKLYRTLRHLIIEALLSASIILVAYFIYVGPRNFSLSILFHFWFLFPFAVGKVLLTRGRRWRLILGIVFCALWFCYGHRMIGGLSLILLASALRPLIKNVWSNNKNKLLIVASICFLIQVYFKIVYHSGALFYIQSAWLLIIGYFFIDKINNIRLSSFEIYLNTNELRIYLYHLPFVLVAKNILVNFGVGYTLSSVITVVISISVLFTLYLINDCPHYTNTSRS